MDSNAGRVALVTGAARGIGRATVAALVDDGYRVMAIDIGDPTPPPGVDYRLSTREQLVELEELYGDRVVTRCVDVREAAALRDAAAECVCVFGGLDAVVAAAAVLDGGAPLWETSEQQLRTLLDILVIGVWNTAAATVPHLLAAPEPSRCRFVALSSGAGERGLFHLAGYVAAKHAVIGIVRGLAADLVGTGVTAVAIAPGATRTNMLDATATLYGVEVEELARPQLLQRVIDPVEVAETIRFCCSAAGALLNGSVVQAGGGLSG